MSADEWRKMMLFAAVAALLYFSFDYFIMAAAREAGRCGPGLRPRSISRRRPRSRRASRSTAPPRLAASPRLPLANGAITGSVALKGGRLDDVSLDRYTAKRSARPTRSSCWRRPARNIRNMSKPAGLPPIRR